MPIDPASAPVTLWRTDSKCSFSGHRWDEDNKNVAHPGWDEFKAIPAPEFDRMERERDAAVALVRKLKSALYCHEGNAGCSVIDDNPGQLALIDEARAFLASPPCPPAKVKDGGAL